MILIRTSIVYAVGALACSTASWASEPYQANTPWVRVPGVGGAADVRAEYLSRMHELPPSLAEAHYVGTRLVTADSMTREQLEALGLPVPGLEHEPTPGILYLAMDGLKLTSTCGNGDSANSALNCSPLVRGAAGGEYVFAPLSDRDQSGVLSRVQEIFARYDLAITTSRPPDFVPYTMAVIGGRASETGHSGAGGVANVSCDGLKRNHVSLTFVDTINTMAETTGQEAAHNWGLEHVNSRSDIMYPTQGGSSLKSFVDQCDGLNGETTCNYVHEFYCPQGGGNQQNGHAELMGIFGPKQTDSEAPTVTQLYPQDGSIFGDDEPVLVSARVSDNSNAVAVRWTWHVPEDQRDEFGDTVTRCTNNVCDLDYAAWTPVEEAWDFLEFNGAPEGIYDLTLEVADLAGNLTTQELSFEIVPAGDVPEGSSGSSGSSGSGSSGSDPDSGGSGSGDSGPGDSGSDDSGPGDSSDSSDSWGSDGTTPQDRDPDGCACQVGSRGRGHGLLAAVAALVVFRPRRRASSP